MNVKEIAIGIIIVILLASFFVNDIVKKEESVEKTSTAQGVVSVRVLGPDESAVGLNYASIGIAALTVSLGVIASKINILRKLGIR